MSQKAMLFLVIGSALALGALSGNPEKTGHDASIPSLVSSLASFNRTLGRRFGVSWNNDTLSLTVSDLNASNAFNGPKTLWSSVPGSGFAAASSGSWDAQERDGSFRVHSEVTGKTTVQTLDTVDFTPGTAGTGAALTLAGQLLLPSNEGVALLPDVSSGGIANYTFAFSSDPQLDGHLKFELSVVGLATTTELNQLFLRYEMEPDEAVYGFGHQYSFANLRGKVVPVMTTEQGIGRGLEPITAILNTFGGGSGGNWHTTYSAIPQYLTSEMRSVFLENSEVAYFDSTANNSGEWQVIKPVANSSCWQQPSFSGKDSNRDDSSQMLRLCGRILAGNNPLDLIEQYTLWAGRMQQLPAWTQNGAVVGFEGGTAAVRNVWAQLKAANVPLAGFWLQDWSGRRDDAGDERLWWNWELDEDYYPGWDALVLEMREAGARMLTYINPYLSNDVGSKKPNFRRDLWAEANASGFLIRNSSGQAYLQSSGITSAFSFGTIDLTQAAARTWTKEIIKCNMLRVGPGCGLDGATTTGLSNVSASGWMCDFGEYVAFDAVLGETGAELSPAQAHNLFPQLWAQTVREAVNEVQQTNHQAAPRGTANDVVFFSRSSAGQSPSFSPLFWMGDQLTTFDGYDGLRSAIVGMMTGGISGHALSHSDIGGFTMVDDAIVIDNHTIGVEYKRSKELLLRWCESSAVADAMFRTHPGLIPSKSWQVNTDNSTLESFARYARMHMALSSYRLELMADAAAHGYPIVRHPFLHYSNDSFLKFPAGLEGAQFMLGDKIMMAPVLSEGADTISVYFPIRDGGAPGDEEWVHWATGESYVSGSFYETIRSPIGRPAIFGKNQSGFLESPAWQALAALA